MHEDYVKWRYGINISTYSSRPCTLSPIVDYKFVGSISLPKPECKPCPHPDWLGTWIEDRLPRQIGWDSQGAWRISGALTHEAVAGSVWSYDVDWTGPRSEGWKRPDELPIVRLARPKTRINAAYKRRVNTGKCGWSDYED
jgi:hypothetical protein